MRPLTLMVLFALLVPCGPDLRAEEASSSPDRGQAFFEWQVLETATGRSLGFEEWVDRLGTLDVVYVGEEHHNRFHVIAAVKLLEALLARGRRPILALEMFSWDVQPAISRFLADQLTAQEFLSAVQWDRVWGGAYDDYAPLIDVARDRHLRVLALNPPRSLVRRVVSVGLEEIRRDAEAISWGMNQEIPPDQAYADMLSKQIELCHPGMSEKGYQRMYEASQFRDEGMAKVITDFLRDRQPEEGPLLSYTGGGHIQYQLPVPKRVLRRQAGAVRQATIYLTAFQVNRAEEVKAMVAEGIADYLWLTPLSAHGAPRRCG